MEYKIITKRDLITSGVDQALTNEVHSYIKSGWKPLGGVTCCCDTIGGLHITFAQAIVKDNKLLKEST